MSWVVDLKIENTLNPIHKIYYLPFVIPKSKIIARGIMRLLVEQKVMWEFLFSLNRQMILTDTWSSIQILNNRCVVANDVDDNDKWKLN